MRLLPKPSEKQRPNSGMYHSLKAFYHASLKVGGHLAMYRFPHLKTIQGICSAQLSTELKNNTGFIIHGFSPQDPAHLITPEVTFKYDDSFELKVELSNTFTNSFEALFDNYLKSNEVPQGEPLLQHDNPEACTYENYVNAIQNAQVLMEVGKLKKVVLSRIAWKNYTNTKDIIQIYLGLCEKYPNAFVSLISSPIYGTWLGASPELLLHQSTTSYTTVALAGTRKSKSLIPFTNKELEEQEIIRKYIEENLYTIGIQCDFNPIENFDTGELTHLKTTIKFNADASKRFEVAALLHPTPAVGGVPKISALEFILENEHYQRKLYAGYIGVIGINEMQLYVNIRCMQWYTSSALLYSGAGITQASDAHAEWVETENKLDVIGSVLAPIVK